MSEPSSSESRERMLDAREDVRRENPISWRGHAGESAHRQPHKRRRQQARQQAREE